MLWWIALAFAVLAIVGHIGARNARRAEALRVEDLTRAIDRLGMAYAEGRTHRADVLLRQVAANLSVQDTAAARVLQVIHESLAIIRATKNAETLRSRRSVVHANLRELEAEYPGVWVICAPEQIESALMVAVSEGLFRIGAAKIQSLVSKAAAAKTAKTRIKYLGLAAECAATVSADACLLASDRAKLLALVDDLDPQTKRN